jgi:aconitase A
MGEYFQPLTIADDSDAAILAWQNSPGLNIASEIKSKIEPPFETDSEELQENMSHTYLPDFKAPKNDCIEMNLDTIEEPKNIKVYKGLIPEMAKEWLKFFKDVFAWTYKDLRGVPLEICQHCFRI